MGMYIKKVSQTAPINAVTEPSLESNSSVNVPTIEAVNKALTPKPNLLLNSDFKSGIINQRGQSEYTKGGYTIDNWYIGGDVSLSIQSGFVRVKRLKAYKHCSTRQIVELNGIDLNNSKFTLTVRIRASKKVKFELLNTQRYHEVGTEWKTMSFTISKSDMTGTLDGDKLKVWLSIYDFDNPNVAELPIGTYMDIEFIKLEQGSIFTGMPVWDEATQLLLCQRFFYRRKMQLEACPAYMNNNNGDFVLSLNLPNSMVEKPTVKVDCINQIYVLDGASFHSATSIKEVKDYGNNGVTLILASTLTNQKTISCGLIGENVTIDFDSNTY